MSTELDESGSFQKQKQTQKQTQIQPQTQKQKSESSDEEPELMSVRKKTKTKTKTTRKRLSQSKSSDDEEPELVPTRRKKTKNTKEKKNSETRKDSPKKKNASSSSSSEIIVLRQSSSLPLAPLYPNMTTEMMLKRKNAKKLSTLIKRIGMRERSTLQQVVHDIQLYNAYIKKITVPQSLNWQKIVHKNSMFQMELDGHLFKINKDCISFKTKNTNTLYIDSYYFDNEIETCCYLSHDDFFDFIKNLAVQLGYVQLKLEDGSHKQMGKCKIPSYIYSLAGKKTFYERFMFKNALYTAKIDRIKDKTIEETFNKVDGPYKNMTLGEAAKIILKECVRQKELDEAPYSDADIEQEDFADDTIELGWATDLLSIMRHLEYKISPSEKLFSFDL